MKTTAKEMTMDYETTISEFMDAFDDLHGELNKVADHDLNLPPAIKRALRLMRAENLRPRLERLLQARNNLAAVHDLKYSH